METECTPELFEFLPVDRRSVVAAFDGGTITSNDGALPRIFWKPATSAGSATNAFLSDPQHMFSVTGFSVTTRAVFRAAFHHVLTVFFNVSSQVSWAKAGAACAARLTATAAQLNITFVRMIGFLHGRQ
jgi:hypothetical protein